jgi:uncharacterized protein
MSTDAVTPAIDTALLAAAATAELEDWGLLEEATGGAMLTSGISLWSSADGSQDAGVWQCTAGPSYWVQEQNEFVHILSGSLTVTPDGGSPRTLGPGDVAVFPRGWRGRWDLHETVRKVYVIF